MLWLRFTDEGRKLESTERQNMLADGHVVMAICSPFEKSSVMLAFFCVQIRMDKRTAI